MLYVVDDIDLSTTTKLRREMLQDEEEAKILWHKKKSCLWSHIQVM
jgi:hypothetical protein